MNASIPARCKQSLDTYRPTSMDPARTYTNLFTHPTISMYVLLSIPTEEI
ncbi:hypothetical protein Hanom_Chr07g00672971 [Helianthus anomalus]